ncbi:MAG: hypothetical protein ACTSRZ_06035 [Promethearchaeota archaeon]
MKFCVFIHDLPYFNKKDVNSGNIPSQFLILNDLIRSIFLLSNNFRKNNLLYIAVSGKIFGKIFNSKDNNTYNLIKLDGEKLRYITPDERVNLLIIQKIFNILNYFNFFNLNPLNKNENKEPKKNRYYNNRKSQIYAKKFKIYKEGKWSESTPGVLVKNFKELPLLCNEIFYNIDKVVLIGNNFQEQLDKLKHFYKKDINVNLKKNLLDIVIEISENPNRTLILIQDDYLNQQIFENNKETQNNSILRDFLNYSILKKIPITLYLNDAIFQNFTISEILTNLLILSDNY